MVVPATANIKVIALCNQDTKAKIFKELSSEVVSFLIPEGVFSGLDVSWLIPGVRQWRIRGVSGAYANGVSGAYAFVF